MAEIIKNTISFCELTKKQVINICNGKLLGCISNLTFDMCSCKVISFEIPCPGGFLGLGKKEMIVIRQNQIEQIGEDAVLVNIPFCDKC